MKKMIKDVLNNAISAIDKVVRAFLAPIMRNTAFFVNIILLLILPVLINAYVINRSHYITFGEQYKFGFWVRGGAGFPFILFMPFTFSYILCFVLVIVSNLNVKLARIAKFLLYIVIFILYAVDIFLLLNFNSLITTSLITLIHQTNQGEVSEFLVSYLFSKESVVSYLLIAISIAYLYFTEKYQNKFKRIRKNRYVCYFIFIFTLYIFQRSVRPYKTFLNLFNNKNTVDVELWIHSFEKDTNIGTNVIYSFYLYHTMNIMCERAIEKTVADNDKPVSNKAINILLVIGESFNKYHSNLYGYQHNTCPLLMQEKNKGNLFVFKNVISAHNLTHLVMINLFSVNSLHEREIWFNYPIFPMLFKKAGYHVYFWDNQVLASNTIDEYADIIHSNEIAKVSYTQCNKKLYKYDFDLVNSFFKTVKLSKANNLLMFHLMGQHFEAIERYPHLRKFEIFSRDSVRKNIDRFKKDKIANYDNATVYNDFVLYSIINHFRKDNAVILYLSDHGDEQYDYRDNSGRSFEDIPSADALKCQYEIPFMIWCSDKFIQENPNKIKYIKQAVNKPFMHDNTSQIMFDLCGIRTKYFHQDRDLISRFYKEPQNRMVNGSVNYDVIMKRNRLLGHKSKFN